MLITEDRMLRRTYLHENRMFTNKVKNILIEGVGKEKDRVMAIKSLINARVERGTLRGALL